MAVLAALAVALAAWFAAAAQGGAGIGGFGVPAAVLAVALVPGVAATVVRRRATHVLPQGKDVVVLTAVTVAGAGVLQLVGWTNGQHVAVLARLLPPAVAGLGLLWPEPSVLRYCLVLCAGSLLGAAVGPSHAGWALAGALVALAAGLVATSRLTAAGAARLGGPATTERRRVGAEAIAVLAVAGLLALLLAALLPAPPGTGGPQQGDRRAPGTSASAPPPVSPPDRLDVGAAKAKPSNAILFRVAAAGPDLWRATTYDRWDGQAWQRSPDPPAGALDGGLGPPGVRTFVRPGIGDLGPGRGDFVQRVTVEAQSTSILIAAARPTSVTPPTGTVDVGLDARLRVDPPLVRGQSYVVESTRADADPATLRAATGDVDPRVAASYLQLPAVPAPVRALAAQVTAGEATTYGKALAVEAWLRDNTRVTDAAPAVPAGVDPLAAFLLTDRSGPAERAATSMAVMLRTQGVPARLALGFLPGTRDRLSGDFVVRGRDSLAWVEVWFPGVGWQRFDPTGRAPAPGARDDSLWARLKRLLAALWPLVVVVALVALVWASWRGLRWWRRRAAEPWATRFFRRIEHAGTARGRPRQPQETPAEYASGLAATVLPDPRLVEVGALVTAAAWSRHEPPAPERARAEAVLRDATRAAPARLFRRLRRPTRPPAVGRPTIHEP